MAAISNNENILSAPIIQIKYIQCNEKFAGTVIAITGILTSLWTNTIMTVGCLPSYIASSDQVQTNMILFSSLITHFLIAVGTIIAFRIAIVENKRSYFKPWLGLKVLEIVLLFIGSILVSIPRYHSYIGLLPIGIIFLLISAYITLCVWNTYKVMPDDGIRSLSDINLFLPTTNPNTQNSVPIDQPPSYDEFTNQVKA